MASYTSNLGLTLIEQGQQNSHMPLNDNATIVDDNALGIVSYDFTGQPTTKALTAAEARKKFLNFWGTGSGALTVTVPAGRNIWIVDNYTGQNITLKTVSGTGIVVPSGVTSLAFCDGAHVHNQFNSISESVTLVDGVNISPKTTTGSKIGTATNQKLGFWNATPIVQPASANQAAVTQTAAATYGANEQAMLGSLKTLVNQLRSDLVAAGLIKGSA
jgi:hypothetical protein